MIVRPSLEDNGLEWLGWHTNIKVIAFDGVEFVEREAEFSHGEDAALTILLWLNEFPLVRVTDSVGEHLIKEWKK